MQLYSECTLPSSSGSSLQTASVPEVHGEKCMYMCSINTVTHCTWLYICTLSLVQTNLALAATWQFYVGVAQVSLTT